MLYPPVAELLTKVESRYLLVNLVARRARQIAEEAEELKEDLPDKPVTMAIHEVADDELSARLKDEYRAENVDANGMHTTCTEEARPESEEEPEAPAEQAQAESPEESAQA